MTDVRDRRFLYASGVREPVELPSRGRVILERAGASAQLTRHMRLVHDCSVLLRTHLGDGVQSVDWSAVHFGAATHDVGKVWVPEECVVSGHRHEIIGERWLREQGVSEEYARFAQTHGCVKRTPQGHSLEEILVGVCDALWKGKRVAPLEEAAVQVWGGTQRYWEVWERVVEVFDGVSAWGDQRREWQGAACCMSEARAMEKER